MSHRMNKLVVSTSGYVEFDIVMNSIDQTRNTDPRYPYCSLLSRSVFAR